MLFYCVFVFAGYGVQKNMSYGAGVASTGVSTSQYTVVSLGLNRQILVFTGASFYFFSH